MNELLAVLVPVLVGIIAAVGGWLNGAAQRREAKTQSNLGIVDRWQKLSDELDEQRVAAETRARELSERIDRLSARIVSLERRDRAWRRYVDDLTDHITKQLPPPPPALPPELH